MSTLGLEATSTLESPTLAALQDKKLAIAINDGTTNEFTFGVKAGQISSPGGTAGATAGDRGDRRQPRPCSPEACWRSMPTGPCRQLFRLGGDEDVLAALGWNV